jgi:hypothetical protein
MFKKSGDEDFLRELNCGEYSGDEVLKGFVFGQVPNLFGQFAIGLRNHHSSFMVGVGFEQGDFKDFGG